jgi:hypothetical protein
LAAVHVEFDVPEATTTLPDCCAVLVSASEAAPLCVGLAASLTRAPDERVDHPPTLVSNVALLPVSRFADHAARGRAAAGAEVALCADTAVGTHVAAASNAPATRIVRRRRQGYARTEYSLKVGKRNVTPGSCGWDRPLWAPIAEPCLLNDGPAIHVQVMRTAPRL